MATATAVISEVWDGPLRARIEVDYNDASDPNDWTLVAFRCVNELARPVTIRIKRGNGASWFSVSVPPGQTRSQNAGGPVQRMSHVPSIELSA